ncbi:MAG: DUF4416 family protein [Verrucomicrobiota bacterium]
MLELQSPSPVKVFAGALWSEQEHWLTAVKQMENKWGTVDARRQPVEFTETDYYYPEMGPELKREFVSFANLQSPAELSSFKLLTNSIEQQSCHLDKRTVNIDVGYLDLHKIVLASTKPAPHKIYLDKGIWADMTLMFHRGDFEGFAWTFPDFKAGNYNDFFRQVRELYKKALRPHLNCST